MVMVTPGMFSSANRSSKVTFKSPIVMGLTSLILLVGFGALGSGEPVAFRITQETAAQVSA